MRKIIAAILIASLAFMLATLPAGALSAPSVSAKSAILIEAESGRVLFDKSGSLRLPMASTTKIITAIVAIEACDDLNMKVTVDRRAVGTEGSSIYLFEGEQITMESLLYALLLASANDAAVAIACAIDGSVEAFSQRMNSFVARLGLSDTHLVNPNGLHDKDHYTTARDLAAITAYALKNETFRKIVSTRSKSIPILNADSSRTLVNHNKMLFSYEGAIGVKTGFTKVAGRCLVSAAERNGLTLIAVTLNAPNDWRDHTSMLDFGFSSYERVKFCDVSYSIPVISGESAYVTVKNSDEMSALLAREREDISACVELPRFVFADVKQGDVLGRITYKCGSTVVASSPLIACEDVEGIKYHKNFFEWIASLFGY